MAATFPSDLGLKLSLQIDGKRISIESDDSDLTATELAELFYDLAIAATYVDNNIIDAMRKVADDHDRRGAVRIIVIFVIEFASEVVAACERKQSRYLGLPRLLRPVGAFFSTYLNQNNDKKGIDRKVQGNHAPVQHQRGNRQRGAFCILDESF
jgi:hypothetical protein